MEVVFGEGLVGGSEKVFAAVADEDEVTAEGEDTEDETDLIEISVAEKKTDR